MYSFNKGETDNERFTIKSDVPVLAHMFCSKKNMKTYLLLMALSVHAIFEGIALGIMDEEREIFYMILAIASHKWVEGVSIVKIFS